MYTPFLLQISIAVGGQIGRCLHVPVRICQLAIMRHDMQIAIDSPTSSSFSPMLVQRSGFNQTHPLHPS